MAPAVFVCHGDDMVCRNSESAEQTEHESTIQQPHALSDLSTGTQVHVKFRHISSSFTDRLKDTHGAPHGLLILDALLWGWRITGGARMRVIVFEMEEEEVSGGSILTSRQNEPRNQGDQTSDFLHGRVSRTGGRLKLSIVCFVYDLCQIHLVIRLTNSQLIVDQSRLAGDAGASFHEATAFPSTLCFVRVPFLLKCNSESALDSMADRVRSVAPAFSRAAKVETLSEIEAEFRTGFGF